MTVEMSKDPKQKLYCGHMGHQPIKEGACLGGNTCVQCNHQQCKQRKMCYELYNPKPHPVCLRKDNTVTWPATASNTSCDSVSAAKQQVQILFLCVMNHLCIMFKFLCVQHNTQNRDNLDRCRKYVAQQWFCRLWPQTANTPTGEIVYFKEFIWSCLMFCSITVFRKNEKSRLYKHTVLHEDLFNGL